MPYYGQGQPLSAKNTKARVGGTVLFQTKWNVTPTSALLDTSNAEEGGYENQTTGLRKCEVTVEGWWNGAANMHDAPLSIYDGAVLQNVALYVNGLASPYWSFPYLTISAVPMMVDVKDLVKYSFQGKGAGSFTYPAGSTSQ